MGLMSFFKGIGEKIFGKEAEEAVTPEQNQLRASALLAHVQNLGLPFLELTVKTQGDIVTLEGKVASQADAEKLALAVGNVEGVHQVDNQLVVEAPEPESQFHTVEKGESLSLIAKKFYGDPMKYHAIFEANKPMLQDVDLIYPGQVLRIPA